MTGWQPSRNAHLHRAINRTRPSRLTSNQLAPLHHPVGRENVVAEYADSGAWLDVTVRCLEPDHVWVASNTCRVERPDYRNRVHHPVVRYVATARPRRGNEELLELAVLSCGATLSNPWWMDDPVKMCKGDRLALLCVACEMAYHPRALRGLMPCELLRRL